MDHSCPYITSCLSGFWKNLFNDINDSIFSEEQQNLSYSLQALKEKFASNVTKLHTCDPCMLLEAFWQNKYFLFAKFLLIMHICKYI